MLPSGDSGDVGEAVSRVVNGGRHRGRQCASPGPSHESAFLLSNTYENDGGCSPPRVCLRSARDDDQLTMSAPQEIRYDRVETLVDAS